MGQKTLILAIFMAVLLPVTVSGQSEKPAEEPLYSVKQLNAMVAMLEKELDGVRKSKAGEIAEKEVDAIEKGIQKAKSRIKEEHLEEAYYILDITKALFTKIEAHMELYYSKQVYESTLRKLKK